MKSIHINLNVVRLVLTVVLTYFILSTINSVKVMPNIKLIINDTTTIPSWINHLNK